jgi:hypothetical protein
MVFPSQPEMPAEDFRGEDPADLDVLTAFLSRLPANADGDAQDPGLGPAAGPPDRGGRLRNGNGD